MKPDERQARRLYSALLNLYPADFRRGYAGELILLFADMHREAAAQGALASARLWANVLLDLASSAAKERIKTMRDFRWATAISVLLCLPLLFVIIAAALNYEPPFVDQYLTSADGYTPTVLGRIVMLGMLISVPAAFVVNLTPMLAKTSPEGAASFRPTPAHIIAGLSLLLILMIVFSQQVLHELRPFVRPLGPAAFLGQGLCFIGLLALPVAVLLNRLPRIIKDRFRPTSINLIVGAAILLIVLTLVATFALETTACAIGVPNCD